MRSLNRQHMEGIKTVLPTLIKASVHPIVVLYYFSNRNSVTNRALLY